MWKPSILARRRAATVSWLEWTRPLWLEEISTRIGNNPACPSMSAKSD